MINDSMKSNKLIGMIQPKTSITANKNQGLFNVGCLGKITSFRETNDGRYLIELKGIIRFRNIEELKTEKNIPLRQTLAKMKAYKNIWNYIS